MAIVVVALIIVVAVDGFLVYRYYDRLDNTRSASVEPAPSRDAAELVTWDTSGSFSG
jgi:hypothetical protein